MLDSTQAKRVIVHVGGDHVYRGKRAFIAIFEFLCRKKVVIPAITSSVAGFGADHHMHTINIERLAENLPVQVEFIATSDTVDEVLPELCEMVGTGVLSTGLVALSQVDVVRYTHNFELDDRRGNVR
ncbi:MAG TPA: DUF190 domain-containing protein [Candidatus Limnocylindrales bacterium]|nr:DUF190 domain-containing protein [Candidatus Limnocylindrales bacterium]